MVRDGASQPGQGSTDALGSSRLRVCLMVFNPEHPLEFEDFLIQFGLKKPFGAAMIDQDGSERPVRVALAEVQPQLADAAPVVVDLTRDLVARFEVEHRAQAAKETASGNAVAATLAALMVPAVARPARRKDRRERWESRFVDEMAENGEQAMKGLPAMRRDVPDEAAE